MKMGSSAADAVSRRAEPQARSRHAHLGSLGFHVRLGEETSARLTAEHDSAAGHRPR